MTVCNRKARRADAKTVSPPPFPFIRRFSSSTNRSLLSDDASELIHVFRVSCYLCWISVTSRGCLSFGRRPRGSSSSTRCESPEVPQDYSRNTILHCSKAFENILGHFYHPNTVRNELGYADIHITPGSSDAFKALKSALPYIHNLGVTIDLEYND